MKNSKSTSDSVSHDVSQEHKLNFELDTLLNTIPSGVLKYAADESEQFEYINRNFVESLGYTRESFKEKFHNCFREMIWHEDREWAENEVLVQEGNGEIGHFDYRVEAADGSLHWIHDEGIKVTDEDGKSWYYVTLVDITDRVEAERQQRELLDNLPCGAALYEFDGSNIKIVHINERFMKLVARDAAHIESEEPIRAIHPDDRSVVMNELYDAIEQNRDGVCDIRLLYGENEYRPFHMEARVTKTISGKYLLYVTYIPISQQELTFRESLPFIFSMIMESSTDISFAKDRNYRYICCSNSLADMLGLKGEADVVGKTDYELFPREVAEQFRKHDSELVTSGKPMIDVIESIPSTDGRTHYARTSKHLLRNTAGEIIGIYGLGTDITESRDTYAKLKLMTDSTPSGLATYVCNEDGIHISYCNNGFCELFGTTRECFGVIAGADPIRYIYEEDRDRMLKQYDELIKSGSQIDCIYRIKINSGELKWVHQRAVVSERHFDTVFVNTAIFDITEQQEALEKLRVSEEVNRLAMEHSGKTVAQFDIKNRTLSLPESIRPIYELPAVLENMPEEQIELGRISPETADAYRKMFNDAANGSEFGKAIFQQRSTLGWRWVETHYTTVFSNAGEPVSAVVTFDDVTEQLEKEVVYHKWQQSLTDRPKDSYTLFRCNLSKNSFFDSCEGTLIDISFANDKQDFGGLTTSYIKHVHYEDRDKYLAFVNSDAMLAGYYRGRRADALEYREITPDDSIRWLRLSVELVEYPNSKDVEVYLMYADINESKLLELQTKEKAETDPLTSVLNRTTFASRMEEILNSSQSGELHALMLVDIDDFKYVNDNYGHEAGDQVLRDLTKQISAKLRRDDLVGRLGGDEFFIFLKQISGYEVAAAKAKQICDMKIGIAGSSSAVSVSMGVAMAPKDGCGFDALYRKVDAALYKAKAAGKNGYQFAGE